MRWDMGFERDRFRMGTGPPPGQDPGEPTDGGRWVCGNGDEAGQAFHFRAERFSRISKGVRHPVLRRPPHLGRSWHLGRQGLMEAKALAFAAHRCRWCLPGWRRPFRPRHGRGQGFGEGQGFGKQRPAHDPFRLAQVSPHGAGQIRRYRPIASPGRRHQGRQGVDEPHEQVPQGEWETV